MLGRNSDAHVHMIWHQMPFENLAFLLPRQSVENLSPIDDGSARRLLSAAAWAQTQRGTIRARPALRGLAENEGQRRAGAGDLARMTHEMLDDGRAVRWLTADLALPNDVAGRYCGRAKPILDGERFPHARIVHRECEIAPHRRIPSRGAHALRRVRR